jgi:plastocyanin
MKPSLKFLVIPLAVGALLFAGCGSDDSSGDNSSSDSSTTQSQPADNNSTSSGKSGTIALAADPSGALAYDTDQLTANAGKVTLDFTNDAAIPHDVVIQDSSGKTVAETDTITGDSTTTEFTAKPGTYTFFCSLPGHEAAGMKGTLTVK